MIVVIAYTTDPLEIYQYIMIISEAQDISVSDRINTTRNMEGNREYIPLIT